MKERIYGKRINLDQENIEEFFKNRSQRYSERSPLAAVLYQDNNPDLAIKRDKYEKSLVIPKLNLQKNDRVLDIGCGIGRWAEPLIGKVAEYNGIDLDEGLVKIAKDNFSEYPYFSFECEKVQTYLDEKTNCNQKYDKIIVAGVLQYLNDNDVDNVINYLINLCTNSSIIYVRSSVSLKERLTLNKVWSEELQQSYSSIYRTDDEHISLLNPLIKNGFSLKVHQALYPENLNNRTETTQYMYILEKRG
ncbi:class I SAM-dependent methyltransferase [Lysinibacillus fusiformis]|uniref:class I SAM-dependent methyltransferase n=1 Tax=Lysinibacillus fusiformis TaxID=28031 RepID=UPI003CE95470